MNRDFVLWLLFVPLCSQVTSANPFPYRATVQSQVAPVRSGPGTEFYATSELSRGETVEIHRHVDNQWCAVRPLPTSFSWVMADTVQVTDEPPLVRVVVDDTHTRVGSHLDDSHHVAYIQLKQGEILRTLGPRQTLPGTSTPAYRVAPPAGEFRWVHHSHLQRVDESNKLATPSADRDLEEEQEATGSGVALASYQGPVRFQKLSDNRMKTFPIPGRDSEPTIQPERSRTDIKLSVEGNPTDDRGNIGGEKRQLDRLDLRLSQMVTQPVDRWRLAPIRSKLERLVDQAANSRTRQRASQLLIRLSQFADLQQRHLELAATAESDSTDEVSVASFQDSQSPDSWQDRRRPAPPIARVESGAADTRSIYDAQGWLIPVFTKRRDIPRFALTDDDGTILFFVSPRSGLNLRRYLRTRVGLLGSVVHTTASEPSQLVVHRVIVLERHER